MAILPNTITSVFAKDVNKPRGQNFDPNPLCI